MEVQCSWRGWALTQETHPPARQQSGAPIPYACESSVNLQKPNVTNVTKYFYARVTLIIKF